MTEVTLNEGEMLWLPAGWFHEVISTSSSGNDSHATDDEHSDGTGKVSGPMAGHLAMNYWFHPPDSADFEKPYSDDFWQSDWAKRRNH